MRNHFYKLQKPCQRIYDRIDLTDEIKEFVLDHIVWVAQKDVSASSTYQIIEQKNKGIPYYERFYIKI